MSDTRPFVEVAREWDAAVEVCHEARIREAELRAEAELHNVNTVRDARLFLRGYDARCAEENARALARIAELEAELELARADCRIAEGIAARGAVTGVVVDEAMVERADIAMMRSTKGHIETLRLTLTAALTSAQAKLVPLAQSDVWGWSDCESNTVWRTRDLAARGNDGRVAPLYRGMDEPAEVHARGE